jgi:hypothetical protein
MKQLNAVSLACACCFAVAPRPSMFTKENIEQFDF